jgi:low affinity Fe/Cu permease
VALGRRLGPSELWLDFEPSFELRQLMEPQSKRGQFGILERFSRKVTDLTGGSFAFLFAFLTIVVWLALGPVFQYSDSWQLFINTGTTIVTFLMVFLIQRAQNKDSQAIHLKLNEIVAALEGASNRLVDVEDLSEAELHTLHRYYEQLAELAKRERNVMASHSIDEALRRHKKHHG